MDIKVRQYQSLCLDDGEMEVAVELVEHWSIQTSGMPSEKTPGMPSEKNGLCHLGWLRNNGRLKL